MSRVTPSAAARSRAIVYIDGFNLYYGAIRGTNFHWLDLDRVCRELMNQSDVVAIRYLSAFVSDRIGDSGKRVRQETFIRALETLPKISVHLGQFLAHPQYLPLADSLQPGRTPQFVRVLRTEEKGSDVNLAAHLMHDAHLNRFDAALVITNDSDLVTPIRLVREELGKPVGIASTHDRPSRELSKCASFRKHLRPGLLRSCRLPLRINDARGEIHCPPKWLLPGESL